VSVSTAAHTFNGSAHGETQLERRSQAKHANARYIVGSLDAGCYRLLVSTTVARVLTDHSFCEKLRPQTYGNNSDGSVASARSQISLAAS
jgi:hypothetical protein